MEVSNMLTPEYRIVLLTSRMTFLENDEKELAKTVRQNIDWYKVLKVAIKHKVVPLLWNNLASRYYDRFVPSGMRNLFYFYSLSTRERNLILFQELRNVMRVMEAKNIICVPVKGGQLIPDIYHDPCLRTMRDLDCLIKSSDIESVRSVMDSLGYVEGEYDPVTESIRKSTRERAIFYTIGMHQLMPFKKVGASDFAKILEFDFAFMLDYETEPTVVDLMISRSNKRATGEYLNLRPADFFLHQCCNIYKDASSSLAVLLGSDLNLMKFCDVREFFLQIMDRSQIIEAIRSAKEHRLEKPVYFALHCLKLIYQDAYEESLMNSLDLKNHDFVDKFGAKELGYEVTWKKDFWQRLFADDNKDELPEMPRQTRILGLEH
jgi:hypothetical protein